MNWVKGEPPKGPCAGDYTEYLCIDSYGSYRIGYWLGVDPERMCMHDGENQFIAEYWMCLPSKPEDCPWE